MKKRLLALALAATLLLSSCNNQTEQTTTTTQAATAVTTTAQTTTTPKVTTTAKTTISTTAETTAPPVEDYKKDWIKPAILDEQIICTAEKRVDEEKLFYELWESCDFDFTKCGKMYEMSKGYDVSNMEKYSVEKNTALGHQHLNQWLDFYYIGTDEADWICVANYMANGFSPGGVYTRIVLVKDNEIVREVCETELNLPFLEFLHGDIFVRDYFSLSKLDLETGELKTITRLGYNNLLCANEKYIVFGGLRSEDWKDIVVVYNRETEALTETDIVIYDSYIGVSSRINGDVIEYFDFSDNKAKICDIETGKIRIDESLDFHEELENDEYIFSSVEEPEAGDSYANGVKITRKSDGETKIFDINLPLYSEPVMRGDWCVFIGGYPNYLLAVNFETEEICKGEYEGVYNISYNPLSDKFYVDDNDKIYTIELKFPAEKVKPAVLDEKIGYTTEHVVDKAKIEKELWENLEFDLTKDESYEYIRKFDEHHTEGIEKNRELGHQFLMQNLYFYYIGREEGDWLCLATYRAPFELGPITVYTKLTLIKDNEIVKEIHSENEMLSVYCSEGDIFAITGFELLKLDLKSGTSTPIMYDNLGSICHIDENLIIYGSSNIQIYNRKTGEITETGIDYDTYVCPEYEIRLNGNRLEYEAFENEKGMVYDLETGEIYEDESLEFYDYAENDKYIVFQRDRINYKTLTITRKSDGLSKEFDITEISPDGNGLRFDGMFVEFWEDWCFISAPDWYAVNFETEEMAACDFISHYSFLNYNSEGKRLYSNTDELTAVIKPNFPAPKIKPAILEEKIGYTTEKVVDKAKIERELWERCDYDYTKAGLCYSLSVEQEDIQPDFTNIKKSELGHQYLYLSTDYKYVGTEQTDWFCIVNYMTDVAIPSLLYSEIVLIKDNQITEQLYECEHSQIVGAIFSDGEYFMTTIGGLYRLHPETKTAELLVGDNYGTFCHIDENLIIYGGSNIQIYNRKTGEITETGINYNTFGSSSYEIRLNGNRLEYVDKDTEKGMVYHIESGEIYEDESLEFYDYAENDEYIVVPEIKDYKYSVITVTRKSDGLSKTFDMSEIAEKTGCKNGLEFVGEWTAFSENRIFLYPQNAGCWYALNFETEEAALCDFTGYGFLYYNSEADCFYSDTRELTAVIKPILPY